MSNDFNLDGFHYQADSVTRDAEQYPRIWWYNGVKQAGTAGHFYTSEREFPNAPTDPWTQVERYDDEVGYMTENLLVAMIRRRSQAYTEDRTTNTKTWHPHYKPGMRIYTEILCLVKGIDEPVVWVVKGMTGKAVTGRKVGIVDTFAEAVLKPAQASWKHGQVPPWAFWMLITGARGDKGKPVYTDTGYGSTVTLPSLAGVPATVTRDTLTTLYVGRDMLDFGLEVYKSSAEWAKTQRTNDEVPATPTAQASEDSVEPF